MIIKRRVSLSSEGTIINAPQTGTRPVMCSGAQGSVSDLERGGGGGGAEVVSTYTEELQGEQEAGS